ncbi:toll-like receptor 4 [Tachypleus tridentatus]|uniref:toll-like receptor 4 n=1 Tax=Tachypleus tridentatus TaxID=6853 RepID=UPI003FD43C7F
MITVAFVTSVLWLAGLVVSEKIWQRTIQDVLRASVDFSDPEFYLRSSSSCLIAGVKNALQVSSEMCFCIPSQDISNKNITTLVIQDTAITSILSEAFQNLTNLESLEIFQNRVTDVRPYAFYGLHKLRFLNLAANSIERLDRDTFIGLENLEEIILLRNSITELRFVMPAMTSSILPSILHIDLGGNPLQRVESDDFIGLETGKLEYLRLHFCYITYIDPQAFVPLHNILGIHLADNKLTIENLKETLKIFQSRNLAKININLPGLEEFPKDVLSVLVNSSVHELYLSSFETITLKNGSFPVMPNLTSLHMPSSQVKEIENGAFDPLINLKNIFLQKSFLKQFPEALIKPQFQVIDLTGFRDDSFRFFIPKWAFANMSDLRELTLNNRRLVTLRNETFFGLYKLEKLSLKNCDISYVDHAFLNLHSLVFLDLSENSLFQLDATAVNTVSSLSTLVHLDISNTILSELKLEKLLYDLKNLEFLDVTDNFLQNLSPGLFQNLKNLTTLKLSNNHIETWNNNIFSTNSKLSKVDLSNNAIRKVSKEMIEDFKILNELSLGTNPFLCSCELRLFLLWLKYTNISIMHFKTTHSQIHYTCTEPSYLQNFPLRNVSLELEKQCQNNLTTKTQKAIILITIIVILFVVLVTVFGAYIYHQRVLKKRHYDQYNTSTKFQFDAFVSYSASDSDWVFNRLIPELENEMRNLKLCVYDRDFVAGRNISDCILDSVKNSRKVILVLSPSFIQSRWCKFETELAQHILVDGQREGLVLIKLRELDLNTLTPELHYLLKSKIYLAWSNDLHHQDVFWKKLHQTLTA